MKYLFIIIFFIGINIKAQNIFEFKFTKIEYFTPASINLPQKNEILNNKSIITLNLDNQSINISTLYPDNEIIESNYQIKSLININGIYKYICLASNYSEVIVEINTKSNWIRRTVTHNNITHKYYN